LGRCARSKLSRTTSPAETTVEHAAPPRGLFQTLAFLALYVIPTLKITDPGLIDVDSFGIVPLA
jgi:adenine deaminase